MIVDLVPASATKTAPITETSSASLVEMRLNLKLEAGFAVSLLMKYRAQNGTITAARRMLIVPFRV